MVNNIQYDSPLGKSDHCCINFEFACQCPKKAWKRKKFFYNKADYTSMRKELDQMNWNKVFEPCRNDPNLMYEAFCATFLGLQEHYVPHKEVWSNSKKNHVPLPEKGLKLRKKKHQAWQRFLETREGEKYETYARLRNKVRVKTRKAKKLLEKHIAEQAKACPKQFWSYATSESKL